MILMASRIIGNSGDIESRVLLGLITGIGFIGGGAILKQEKITATVWNMAVIGAATGFGIYDIAVILAVINLLALRLLSPLKKQIDQRQFLDSCLQASRESGLFNRSCSEY